MANGILTVCLLEPKWGMFVQVGGSRKIPGSTKKDLDRHYRAEFGGGAKLEELFGLKTKVRCFLVMNGSTAIIGVSGLPKPRQIKKPNK